MPMYIYSCPKCNKDFEVLLKITEHKNPHPCPTCSTDSEQLISGLFYTILKGSDWPGKFNRSKKDKWYT